MPESSIPPQAMALWRRYGQEPHACPDCKRDPVHLNEEPMENPEAAAADHRPPRMAPYCNDCKQILATRYGYGWGAWPSTSICPASSPATRCSGHSRTPAYDQVATTASAKSTSSPANHGGPSADDASRRRRCDGQPSSATPEATTPG